MKSLLLVVAAIASLTACGQGNKAKPEDKSKRPSPPALAKETLSSGAVVTIDYSQSSVKGTTVGKDLEPKQGQVWRAGANEATTFEVSKDVKVEGQPLPAGKYAFFTLWNKDDSWTLIFNKQAETWGAYDYDKNKEKDALKVNVKPGKASSPSEKLTYTISKDGKVSLLWSDVQVDFNVQ